MARRFDNQVILITGSSRGLGRAFAEYFASLGAQLIIHGQGNADEEQAEQTAVAVTVDKIRRQGGLAEGIELPISKARQLIDFCLQRFGRLDAVVHAAGFVRDAKLNTMTYEDWSAVLDVHLNAAFELSRAVWSGFCEQQAGKLLFIGSASGLYGNRGQANYAAAKSGLTGLTKTLALEGAGANIQVNCIAPVGVTVLNRHLLNAEQLNRFAPEKIAPLVAWLCHPDCSESGSLFEAAGGWFGKVHTARSVGASLRAGEGMDQLAERWSGVISSESLHPVDSITESLRAMEWPDK